MLKACRYREILKILAPFDTKGSGKRGESARHVGGENESLGNMILQLCRDRPKGLKQQTINEKLARVSLADQARAINQLLKQGNLQLFKDAEGSIVYREVKKEELAKFNGISDQEMVIYKLIEQSSSKGIWTRDLRFKGNMQTVQIQRILKTLEARKLVKSVKSVVSKNKKVYMLYNIEPSREVTGGAWYSEQEFDSSFVDVLCQLCLSIVSKFGKATLNDIFKALVSTHASKVELSETDVGSIVDVLVHDRLLDESVEERDV